MPPGVGKCGIWSSLSIISKFMNTQRQANRACMSGMSRWLNFHQSDLFGGDFKRIMYKAILNRHCKLIVTKSFCLDLVNVVAAYEKIGHVKWRSRKKQRCHLLSRCLYRLIMQTKGCYHWVLDSDEFDVRMRGSAADSSPSGGLPR